MRFASTMRLTGRGSDRRGRRPRAVPHRHPLAPVPFGLGVVRRLEVATGRERLLPPHPAPGLLGGRGGDAWGRAKEPKNGSGVPEAALGGAPSTARLTREDRLIAIARVQAETLQPEVVLV